MEFQNSTKVLLTAKILDEATTTANRIELRDTSASGLVLRISRTGHKVLAYKFRNGTQVLTVTLGCPGQIGLKEARAKAALERAKAINSTIRTGPRSARIVTLKQLLIEAQPVLAQRKRGGTIWSPRPDRTRPDAVAGIESVFGSLLEKTAKDITIDDLCEAIQNHKKRGKTPDTLAPAPGAAGKATSYLSTLFDWASHRGQFEKRGAGRPVRIDLADIHLVDRPATTGTPRDRYLNEKEIAAVYPVLKKHGGDEGKAAHFFLLTTKSRRGSSEVATWEAIDFHLAMWTRRSKGGKVTPIGLPPALTDWLKTLPSYLETGGTGPIFRNSDKTGSFTDWANATKRIQAETGTSNWHRHDLRRTTSVYLDALTDDTESGSELLDHADRGQGRLTAAAVNRQLFDLPEKVGVMKHYASMSAEPIARNRITRTRRKIATVMQFYEDIAAASSDATPREPTDRVDPVIATKDQTPL